MSIGIFASSAVAAGNTYADEVLADSPLFFLKLDESTGTTAADSSGNSRDFATTSLGWSATGLCADGGTAATFLNTVPDRALLADAAWMDATSLTFEAWVNFDAGDTSGSQMLTCRYDYTTSDHHAVYRRDTGASDGGKLDFFIWTSSAARFVRSTSVLSLGTTYHLVCTYNGATGYQAIYIDGSLDASTTHGAGNIKAVARRWELGAGFNVTSAGAGWEFPLNGEMDNIAAYGSALSSTRVAAHYAAGT